MKTKDYQVKPISREEATPYILEIHYARRFPSISFYFGLFYLDNLVGVCTFGSPTSAPLCRGIAGEENKSKVIELNRLCLLNNIKNEASFLVSQSIKLLPKPKIIVSYADTAQKHSGIVYQACNFLFTGTSKPRTDIAGEKGKHPRHHAGDRSKRVNRSSKHRYVYLHGSKTQKKQLKNDLKYNIEEYPK